MREVKTWKQKSDCLDDEIQDLIDYHKDNYSLELIQKRFLEHINSIKNSKPL